VDYIGPYLLDSLRATEGAIEIWNAQDAVTGVPALVYKPVIAELPRWRIEGVLPWTSRVADAWVAELPFGARPLSERSGGATAGELTAWARRMLATLLEMRALELSHGRISPGRLWAKGEEIWLEGLGLPVPAREPDEVALVAALKEAAGDSWQGWPYHKVMERLAEGGLSLREAAEMLAEPVALDDDEEDVLPAEPDSGALEPPPVGTVRVLGRGEARPKPQPAEPAGEERQVEERPAEPSQPESAVSQPGLLDPGPLLDEGVGAVRPAVGRESGQPEEIAAATRPDIAEEAGSEEAEEIEPAPPKEARATRERPVVRIDEVSEPAFEVIEPQSTVGRRAPYRLVIVGLTLLLLVFAFVWYGRHKEATPAAAEGYAVEFRLEPAGEHAELVLLEAPEGSKLVPNRVLAVIPGKVYFDVPGVYRIQLRADGYLPQEKSLVIPPSSRVITVRLSH